jgi:beta-1,2-mannobiose phosphorylase / 1,2-beta-oligomannan phosphorylase
MAPGIHAETNGGWIKHNANPVLGGKFGTIFDISVLKDKDNFRMWSSWRPQKSVALSESTDGVHWTDPEIVLGPAATGWEDDINRPVVVKCEDGYHLWYTGQTQSQSWIGYAQSADGKKWKRMSDKPVISPDTPWEKTSVMCPHVEWDDKESIFKMWYSGGEQYEPDAIGYATSRDGLHWDKRASNPVFASDPKTQWEQAKVTACQVIRHKNWYVMFFIGFENTDLARIGIARSKDGITNWIRHPANPIIAPGSGWDASAVYKPYAILDKGKWMLWYNGRNNAVEQIGMAVHQSEDLGFAD